MHELLKELSFSKAEAIKAKLKFPRVMMEYELEGRKDISKITNYNYFLGVNMTRMPVLM